jgi:NAD(P)-dependent dehydrogenase (short-subunit alcohol dehydrogenase family)
MRVLVTGASRGIGLALCAAYAERGDDVFAVCRAATPALTALEVRVIDGIELESDEAVAGLPAAVGPHRLDAVICNAAINVDSPGLEDISVDALARTLNVNALGAVRTVLATLPLLEDGGKIMLVGTGTTALNVGKVPSRGNYGYRMSKAALTSFGFGLARDLRDRGIAVVVSAPGPVDTDMLRDVAAGGRTSFDPAQASAPIDIARTFRDRLDRLTLDDSPAWDANPAADPVRI